MKAIHSYGLKCRSGVWFPMVLTLLIAGCAGGPAKKAPSSSEGPEDAIVVTDEVKVDSEVRRDFSAATELLAAEEYEKGMALLGKVISRSPKSTAPYINLAMAYRKQKKLDKAEEQVKKALELNPTHPAANDEYAKIQRRKGNFAEARKLYEALLDEYPGYHPARKNLGILCDLYLQDLECALEQYEIYSEAKPDDEKVTLWIADLQRRI